MTGAEKIYLKNFLIENKQTIFKYLHENPKIKDLNEVWGFSTVLKGLCLYNDEYYNKIQITSSLRRLNFSYITLSTNTTILEYKYNTLFWDNLDWKELKIAIGEALEIEIR